MVSPRTRLQLLDERAGVILCSLSGNLKGFAPIRFLIMTYGAKNHAKKIIAVSKTKSRN
ncbi:hypothetical protein BDN72DRAFT_849942 [Pluteus cervinus]|uniref:Uncharacterized protein n=1 Tax=Pluteus cervinus TaxID=181527 RepID=A0ACD3A6G3_9AGAR|nr:hypothetical protein BDN72DRAFT_849942 [Pluteus cervinus]